MSISTRPLALSLLVLAVSVDVQADEENRFYATGYAGINALSSQDFTYRDNVTSSAAEADFDASFTGGGTLGYELNERWRLEGELAYRRNEMDAITLDGVGVSSEGDFASLVIGVSAIYEFPVASNERLKLYVGAGPAFIQEIDVDFEVNGNEISFETDEIGFQAQFGGRYAFSDRLFLDLGLRYLSSSNVEMTFPADGSRVVESDYSPVSVSVGVGWRF